MSAAAGLGLSERDRGRLEEIEEIARGEDVAPLVAALDEPSWVVRRGVVAALARAGDAALGPVVEVLRSARGHEGRLAAAVDALVASRGAVEAAMFALLREDPPAVVICDVAQILGRRKSEGALEALGAMALHEDDNVAIAAIEALGRIGGPGTCAALVAAVACRSFFRTFPAIRALGATGDARAVAPLASLLDDPLYALDAVIALGETGREEAIAPLLVLLDASDAALVRAAAGALVELDHRAQVGAACPRPAARVRAHAAARGSVRSLGAALQQADDAAAVRVARVLGWVADDAAIAILFELLARDGAVAAAASSALRDAGPRVEARLGAALSAGGSATRRRLLPLVGALAVDREVIAACLDDDDAAVRALACEAWARTGEARDVSRLFSRVSDADAYVAQAASAAVQALGGAEIRALALRGARSADARTRRASLRVVGYFGDPEALPVLRAAIGDVDPRVAEAALVGLSLVGEAEATAAIVAAAAHASPKIRAAAARALGGTSRTDGVVGALTRGLDDADAWTRYYACRSLGRLGVTAAADAIALRLEDAAGQVRVAAVEALATLGGEVAARALAGAAAFGDADARRAALVGLGMAHRDESLATVNDAVTSTDVATRLIALSALACFDAEAVVGTLARATRDPNESVRRAAVGLLARRAGEDAAHELVDLVGAPLVGADAAAALDAAKSEHLDAMLVALDGGSPARAAVLVGVLARAAAPVAAEALGAVMALRSVGARRAAASALVRLGTTEARAALTAAAGDDPDEQVRRIAGEGLRGG